jgi:osmoprotectant transport system permease protein
VGSGAGEREGGLMETFVDAFRFIGENPGLMWEKTVDHVVISAVSVAVAMAISLPLGVWLGHVHRGSFVAINASNIGRALPSLAIISIMLGIVGIGFWNVLIAMVILAVPPILTNAYVAVDGVDADAVEAARGMGMRPHEVLLKVELPLALPLIFAGLRTAVVYVIATAALASIAGASSLGDIILNQPTYRLPGVVAGSIAVAALAFAAEGFFALVQRAATPRGLREERAGRLIGPAIEGV